MSASNRFARGSNLKIPATHKATVILGLFWKARMVPHPTPIFEVL